MKHIKDFLIYLSVAFSFLTVIPNPFIKKIRFNKKIIELSIIFYPLVGLFYGLSLYWLAIFLKAIKADIYLASFFIIALPFGLNKFFHFDGLCDTFDAFFSDKSPKERLRIMKDSTIGSFALGAGVLFILLKFIIIKNFLSDATLLSMLILFPVLSRYGMILLSFVSEYPRKKGTASFIVGKISGRIFFQSTIMLVIIFVFFLIIFGFDFSSVFIITIMLLFLFLFLSALKKYSYIKINGITGDVLGAALESLEVILPAAALFCYEVFFK